MGQLAIPDGAIVYLDTAPIIYSIERHADYWQLLTPLWQKLQAGSITLISSELLILECLVAPLKANDQILIDAYEQFLSTRITLLPIQESILRSAAQLRASNKLKTPDSIHTATALSQSPTLFLTNDAGLHNIPNLAVVVLKDILSA